MELRSRGATVIFSTHDMAVAEKLCDFIFMIHNGRKVLDGTLDTIQGDYGQDTLRVKVEDNTSDLSRLPGVEHITDFGQLQELRVSPVTDTQEVLAALMERGRVAHFEQVRPSLHDIFVRIAKSEATDPSSVELN